MLRRFVFAIAIFSSVSGSLPAADWTRYVNPRFGAAVDIPADFAADGPAQVAGEGRRFRASSGRAVITAWGGPAQEADFLTEMRRRIGAEEAEGWAITYRSETPDWAAWGGTRGGHVFYAKTILVCDGQQTANVRLDYPAVDVPGFDALVNRLGQSLGQDGACF
ncbi:MAG: hypothetical protein RIB57_11430 [Pelagibacterium sp.]|uniref:hypothetical protein n=1 Tax=Pelagibacterium sp. TaxID=1967288 RepID=UPI0032EE1F60